MSLNSRLNALLHPERNDRNTARNNAIIADIIETAEDLSRISSISIEDIVGSLARTIVNKHSILPDEFETFFIAQEIPLKLVDLFIEQVATKHPIQKEEINGQNMKEANTELERFISNEYGDSSNQTLDAFANHLITEFPNIDLEALFTQYRGEIANKIIDAFQQKIKPKLMTDYANDRDYLMNRLFRQAFHKNGDQLDVEDPGDLQKVVNFLEDAGFHSEGIYEFIREELIHLEREREKILRRRVQTRGKIHEAAPEIELTDAVPYTGEAFDEDGYNAFFNRHIVPAIQNARARKLPTIVRLVDSLGAMENGKVSVLPEAIYDPFQRINAMQKRSPKAFLRYLRGYFNYDGWPGPKITDEQVKALLASQLALVDKEMQTSHDAALKGRSWEDDLRREYQFSRQIRSCRDVGQLIQWIADPASFNQASDEAHVSDAAGEAQHKKEAVIRHQAMVMFLKLIGLRQELIDDSDLPLNEQKTLLETHLRNSLKIEVVEQRKIRNKVRIPIPDLESAKEYYHLFKSKEYRPKVDVVIQDEAFTQNQFLMKGMVYDPDLFTEETSDKVACYKDPATQKCYLLFPEENYSVKKLKMKVPNLEGEEEDVEIYVYDNGDLISEKSLDSRLSAIWREKKPSDLLRWTVIPCDEVSRRRLMDHLYRSYTSLKPLQVKDGMEKRHIQQKQSSQSKANKLGRWRGFHASMYAIHPDVVTVGGMVVDAEGNLIDRNGQRLKDLSTSLEDDEHMSETEHTINNVLHEKFLKNPTRIRKRHRRIHFETQGYDDLASAILVANKHSGIGHDEYVSDRELIAIKEKTFPAHLHPVSPEKLIENIIVPEILIIQKPGNRNADAVDKQVA